MTIGDQFSPGDSINNYSPGGKKHMGNSNCDKCGHDKKMCICHPSDFVNDRHVDQVGGKHYQSKYQHWDWVAEQGLDYFQACSTKYISRWQDKGGIEDIEKGISYVEKLMALSREGYCDNQAVPIGEEFVRFHQSNKVEGLEREICFRITTWSEEQDLVNVIIVMKALLLTAQGAAS